MFKNSRFVFAETAYPPTMREPWRDGVDFGILKAKLRHRRVMIAWSVLLGALLAGLAGYLYALARNPLFSASTDLLISNTTLQVSGPDAAVTQVLVENSLLESAMVLLKSGQVLERVIDRLGLETIESTLPKRLDILRFILPPMPGEIKVRDNSRVAIRQAAVAKLRANLRVERIGASLIIAVRASAVTAAGAAALADAVARAFVEEQDLSNALVTTSAAFRERIKVLGASARVISGAVPPRAKDSPSALVIIALAGVAGGFLGLGWALTVVLHDRRVRSAKQLASLNPAEFLGYVPRLELPMPGSRRGSAHSRSPAHWPLEKLAPVLQRARVAALERLSASPCILGITSCLPGEGKTTLATSLARLVAREGRRVLLMDAHEDNPTLSHILAPGAVVGLQQVLTGRAKFSDAVWTDVDQHLDFLPYGEAEADIDTQWPEFVGAMAADVGPYAWIILDLPPLAPGAEVRSAGAIVDGLLFVVARGRTQESSIEEELRFLGPVRDKLFWFVINDAPPHLSRQRPGSGKQSSPCWPERPGSGKQGTLSFGVETIPLRGGGS